MDGDHASQDTWDSIISGVARTNNNFNNACASLLETFIDPRDYQHFLQYLTLYRKPASMKAQALASRLSTVLAYASKLPNGEDWDEERKKRQFSLMFSLDQQATFQRSHSTTANVTWTQLVSFYRTFDNTSNSNGSKKKRNQEDARIRGGGGKHKKTNKNDNNMCRIHSNLGSKNHTWHNCIFNKNGPKFNAEKFECYKARQASNSNDSGGNNSNSTPPQNPQSYHQERCPATGHTHLPPLGVVQYQNGAKHLRRGATHTVGTVAPISDVAKSTWSIGIQILR